MRNHKRGFAGKFSGLRTETGYKAVSWDERAEQREVQVARRNSKSGGHMRRKSSLFSGEISSTPNRGEERHAEEAQ